MSSKRDTQVTPKGTIMYPNLWEPTTFEEGKDKTYNVVIVIPKTEDISALKKAVKECAVAKFGDKTKGLRSPIRDGNEKAEDWGEVLKDAWFIRASTKSKPVCVNARKQDILDEEEIYSGCKGRLVIAPFAYDNKGNRGISFGLDVVQKIADGEALGGGRAALKHLDDLPEDDIGGRAPDDDDMFGESEGPTADDEF